MFDSTIVKGVLFFSFSLCILYVGFIPTQSDFSSIIIPYVFAFGIYAWIIWGLKPQGHVTSFILLAIVLRCILVFGFPNLSDDIYRFLWDGYLILGGHSPYSYLPSDLILKDLRCPGITADLYKELNSPEYFTIYPSISQLVYVIGSAASNSSWHISSIVIKSILLLSELFNIHLLIKILDILKMDRAKALIYILNPLVIIEIMGNVHLEGVMLSGVLLFYYLLLRKKDFGAGLALAVAIATKLIPLIYLPFLLLSRRRVSFYIALIVLTFLLFLPILMSIPNFGTSLNLYFQRFEFNASLYYLFRALGHLFSGYNMIHVIGPALAIATVIGILQFHYSNRQKILLTAAPYFFLLTHMIHLSLATTVHPWYLILPLAWCVFTSLRFPIVWSCLIFLSYINYSYDPYFENMWILALQYAGVVGILFLDWKDGRFSILPTKG